MANYTGIALFLITLQASTILFMSESGSSSGPSIGMPGVGVGVTKGYVHYVIVDVKSI